MPARAMVGQLLREAEDAFGTREPAYAGTRVFDELRAREYGRLDATGSVYLDYTGGGLYAESQLSEHLELLRSRVFGNPHSTNPTSRAMTDLVESTRRRVLDYFRADPDEYLVIFTPNCTGALRLVGEAYPFSATRPYALTWDNHNSVNGVREFARARGAPVRYLPFATPELRVDVARLLDELRALPPGLLAFPAQSNFSGVQHPLDLVTGARGLGWDVLLDCAAFVPTNRLDLSVVKPDFVPLSFYKIFGYPTGVGALIVRRELLARLRRPWFAGGTISIVSVQGEGWHYLSDGEAGFEDGTVNYLSLPAVGIGLRHIEAVGIERIHQRVMLLTGWLLEAMAGATHGNGAPLFHVHGPAGTAGRGATIAFLLLDDRGRSFDYQLLEADAGAAGISLRTGCFCNPGTGEYANGLPGAMMGPFFGRPEPVTFRQMYVKAQEAGKDSSSLRVSLGIASNFADVWRFMRWAETFRDRSAADYNASGSSRPNRTARRTAASRPVTSSLR